MLIHTYWHRSVCYYPQEEYGHLYLQNLLPMLRRYDTSAANLPADIKSYLQSPTAAASMLQAKSKNDRKQLVEMITSYQLMRGVIKLFSLDPMLAFCSPKVRDGSQEYIVGLCSSPPPPQSLSRVGYCNYNDKLNTQ